MENGSCPVPMPDVYADLEAGKDRAARGETLPDPHPNG